MALDTAVKRRSAAGVPFLPLGPGVTSNAAKPVAWRQQAGWGYSGIETSPDASSLLPGAIFVRDRFHVDRVFHRDHLRINRVFSRAIFNTDRVFQVQPNHMPINSTLYAKDSNETVLYVFDFSNFPEVIAGGTLSSPVVVVSPTGPTIGTPAVTTVIRDGVPVGKGVESLVSGGSVGVTYTLEARVTIGGTSIRVVKGRLQVE